MNNKKITPITRIDKFFSEEEISRAYEIARRMGHSYIDNYKLERGREELQTKPMGKEIKICSVCQKEVRPPIQWWDEPYNA